MKSLIAIVLLSLFVIINCKTTSGDTEESYRAYSAVWYPYLHPRSISLTGIEAEKDNNEASIDAVQFNLTDLLETALAFEYFHESAETFNATTTNYTNVNASLFAFIFRFYLVFEYNEMNGIAGFQNGSDLITGLYDLSNAALPWNDMVINATDVIGSDGNTYKLFYVTIQTTDQVFALRFTVAGTNVNVPGAHLNPESAKIDLFIQWFQPLHVAAAWTTGPSDPEVYPNAQVGFGLAMGALAEAASTSPANDNQNPTVNFTAGEYVGYFSWAMEVDVEDQSGDVTSGDVYSEIFQIDETAQGGDIYGSFEVGWVIRAIFFSFEGSRPSAILWDPQVGAVIPADESSSSSNSGSVLIPFATLFATIFISLILFQLKN